MMLKISIKAKKTRYQKNKVALMLIVLQLCLGQDIIPFKTASNERRVSCFTWFFLDLLMLIENKKSPIYR